MRLYLLFLYKVVSDGDGNNIMNAQILESCHDNVGGCHLGRDKTVDSRVVSRYYWKGVRVGKDTEEWVSHCCLCVHLVPA